MCKRFQCIVKGRARRYWKEGKRKAKEKFLTLGTFFVTTTTCRCNRVIQYMIFSISKPKNDQIGEI